MMASYFVPVSFLQCSQIGYQTESRKRLLSAVIFSRVQRSQIEPTVNTKEGLNMRIALLSRVSTSKQDCENQLLQLRQFASRQGWEIVEEFVDVVTGSGRRTRERFDAMMLSASRREFDILLFWSLDRLSREGVFETLQHLQRLTSYGVAWRSFTEQYLDSTGIFRDAVIGILAAVAKQERVRLSERTKAGLERARHLGHIPGPKAFTVDMDEVRSRKAAGESLRSIARSLQVSPALLIKREKKGSRLSSPSLC